MSSNRFELSKYRLEKAKDDLKAASDSLENAHFSTSVSRAYYSIFHAMRAILAHDGFDAKKHSNVISRFHQDYLKTNLLDKSYSKIIGLAFEMRNRHDYDDFVVVTRDEVNKLIANASIFLEAVEAYLEKRWQRMETEDE